MEKDQVVALPSSRRAPQFSADDSIEITIAPNAGACFGVVRAIKLGYFALNKAKGGSETGPLLEPVRSLGPLIHNPMVVDQLSAQGVQSVTEASEIESGTAILRSHGVRKEIEEGLRSRGVKIIDATCPLVKKPQRIAQSLGEKGYFLVFVGDEKHPEVKGVLSYFARDQYVVTYDETGVGRIPEGVEKVGIIAQTTIEHRVFENIVAQCRARFQDVVVHNTICDATSIRQSEAESLARGAEVVVVVGGRNSSNTRKLEKICRTYQPETFLIETIDELDVNWFVGKRKIGVTGGASTPQEYVDSVGERIAQLLTPA